MLIFTMNKGEKKLTDGQKQEKENLTNTSGKIGEPLTAFHFLNISGKPLIKIFKKKYINILIFSSNTYIYFICFKTYFYFDFFLEKKKKS